MIRVTNRGAVQCIEDMAEFSNAQGSFSGRFHNYNDATLGKLSYDNREALRLAGDVRYIVYSYATPIAWALGDNTWVIPGDKYSVTTSKHQGIMRYAISRSGNPAIEV